MATQRGIRCDRCGFDNGDDLGDSGRCAGCGIPLGPADDHERPAPGFRVPDRDRPFVVPDHAVEQYPELEGVKTILRLDYEWGDGVGAAPYGYHTTRRIQVVDLDAWDGADWFREDVVISDECPECGASLAVYSFSQDRAGIVGSRSLSCAACEHEHYRERWD